MRKTPSNSGLGRIIDSRNKKFEKYRFCIIKRYSVLDKIKNREKNND